MDEKKEMKEGQILPGIDTITITIVYQNSTSTHTNIPLSTTTVNALKRDIIHPLTNIPPHLQKIFVYHKTCLRVKEKEWNDTLSLETILLPGTKSLKVMVMGSPEAQVEKVVTKTEQMKQNALIAVKLFSSNKSASISSSSSSTSKIHGFSANDEDRYTFQSLRILPQYQHQQSKAMAILNKLKSHRGIQAIMKNNKWTVGSLIELCPKTSSHLLGYNQNKGQVIALRLRTDDLTGFRSFGSILKVLTHELTHMVHSDHDDKFKSLNSLLNKQVVELDWTKGTKGHRLTNQVFYNPPSDDSDADEYGDVTLPEGEEYIDEHGYDGGAFVLGSSSTPLPSSAEGKREVLAEAALKRLTLEKEKGKEKERKDK